MQSVLDTFMKRKTQASNRTVEPCSYLTDEQVIAMHHLPSQVTSSNPVRWQLGRRLRQPVRCGWRLSPSLHSGAGTWKSRLIPSSERLALCGTSGTGRPVTAPMGKSPSTQRCEHQRDNLCLRPGIFASAEDDFVDTDAAEEEHASFTPDISRVTLTLEEMKPHTNPRYGREEIRNRERLRRLLQTDSQVQPQPRNPGTSMTGRSS